MTEAEMRAWIDNASYEDLLRKWRFAPSGDPFFAGAMGDYYQKRMADKRAEVGDAAHTSASKRIGWER
jgi:hypothetical protein